MKHTTKKGEKIELEDLEDSHLNNIINWIERKAKEGFVIRMGGGSCSDDFWYEEKTYKGKKALKYLRYKKYVKEQERRKLIGHE
jgi:hypothetical protein